MKASPMRLDPASYPRHKIVPIRFSDIDMFKHLNNVASGQFYEEGRYELLADARAHLDKNARGALVIANVNMSFLRSARYPGLIDVATGVVRVGGQSLVIGQALFVDGACIGIADSVVVSADASGSAPLPEAVASFCALLMLPVEEPAA